MNHLLVAPIIVPALNEERLINLCYGRATG